MNFLRKSALTVAASFLVSSLLLFGLALGIERVLGRPDGIKQALQDSNVYETIVSDILAQAEKEQSDLDKIPVGQDDIKAVIAGAFPPRFLQAQTEGLVDVAYKWLRGDIPEPSFRIDAAEAKTRLANGLGALAGARMATLPACAAKTPPATDVDPFNATCIPKGVDTGQVVAKLQQEIQGDAFLKDSALTGDELKTKDGRTFGEAYRKVPEIYQKVVKGVYAAGAIALLLAVAVVFLSINWRKGLRKLAVIGATVGIILIACSWLLGWFMTRAAKEFAASAAANEPFQEKTLLIVQHIIHDINMWWLRAGLVLAIVGVGGFAALTLLKQKPDEPHSKTMEPRKDDSAAEPAEHNQPPKKGIQKQEK